MNSSLCHFILYMKKRNIKVDKLFGQNNGNSTTYKMPLQRNYCTNQSGTLKTFTFKIFNLISFYAK